MTDLKQLTLDQIRLAANEIEVESVINEAFTKLQRKKVNALTVKEYQLNMTLSLLSLKRQPLTPKSNYNVNKAIEIFRKLNRAIE
ncbi:MAG: hypothetical protein AABY93_12300 [Bacteroidota bacterium]